MALHPKFTLWRDRLDALLEEAAAQVEADDIARRAVAQLLHGFIRENPSSIPSDPTSVVFEEMDAIARAARDALFLDTVGARLVAITGRTFELGELEKKIRTQTAFNQQEAMTLRLEKSRQVVTSTTAAIDALKDLRMQLEAEISGDESLVALSKRITKVVDTLQELRTQVEETS